METSLQEFSLPPLPTSPILSRDTSLEMRGQKSSEPTTPYSQVMAQLKRFEERALGLAMQRQNDPSEEGAGKTEDIVSEEIPLVDSLLIISI
jgi:hypothetical protein